MGPSRLRTRPPPDGEGGFTIVEMVVALTLMTGVLLSLAFSLFGAMRGLTSSRQRSAFVEIGNGEMETLRAISYDSVGVASGDTATYTPGSPPTYEGRDAVIVASGAPPAVSTVTTSLVRGIVLPYTVRRWVTWTDTFGGTAHQFKRLNVEVEWRENNQRPRVFRLTSVLYPGGGVGVSSTNQAPVAVIAPVTPANGPPGTTFSFDGTGSSDPDSGDSVVTYSWNFGDGTIGMGPTVSHPYTVAGVYTVTLTVVDTGGKASAPASRNVGVGTTADNAPTASFTFGPVIGTAPLTATFTSTSQDGEGPLASWDWDWGDGTAHGTTEQATHVFETAGTFTVRLTVTDSGGLTSSATGTIQVDPLNCDVTSGSFNNPSTNSVANDVQVDRANKPVSRSFQFTATTNDACTSVVAQLPYQGAVFTVILSLQSTLNGVRTWTGSGSVGASDRFNVGSDQTATVTGDSGSSPDLFNYSFNVHS